MRKAAIILLLCTYTLATMGVAIKNFYCCGELQSVTLSLLPDVKKTCSKGQGAGCCDNKYTLLKVKDNHFASDKVASFVKYLCDLQLPHLPTIHPTTFAAETTAMAYSSHAPPGNARKPIYLLNCVFII